MNKLVIFLLILTYQFANGQERLLFSANSYYIANSECIFSVSIGEPVIGDLSGASIIINQGFIPIKTNESTTNILKEDIGISLYPNPFASSLSIRGLNISGGYTISFITTDGRVVHKEKIQSKTMNTSFLPSGSYLVMITGEKEVFKDIFIKK